jgi:hypothetical protein
MSALGQKQTWREASATSSIFKNGRSPAPPLAIESPP